MKIALDIFLDGGARGLEHVFCKCLHGTRGCKWEKCRTYVLLQWSGIDLWRNYPHLCGKCGDETTLPFSRLQTSQTPIVIDEGKKRVLPTTRRGHIMKVIINDCFGGFGIDENVVLGLGYSKYDRYSDALRTDPRIIAMVENGENVGTPYSDLVVATIPDDVSDWWLEEYDGLEELWYIACGDTCRTCWEPEDEDVKDYEEED